MRFRPLVAAFVLVALLASVPASASANNTVVSCPFANVNSGDFTDRGFYLSNYPGSDLADVTIAFTDSPPGAYSINLTARSGAYDGPVVGSSTVPITLTSDETQVTFPFGGVPVARGSTIAFKVTSQGPAAIGWDDGVGPCQGVTETEGTTPPLDTFRRDSIGLIVTEVPPNDFTYSVSGRSLLVNVSSPGVASVADAAAPLSAEQAKKKRRLLLKPSSASGTPPTISVPLLLSKAAKKKLRQKGKVTVKARMSFTPNGGAAGTQTAKLKITAGKKR